METKLRDKAQEMRSITDLVREDHGQDLAEYAMLSALIVVVVIVAMMTVGTSLSTIWTNISNVFAALP